MLKPCLAGGLLLTAMVGTTSASPIAVGGFVTAGAVNEHPYGDDGMVFSAVPAAECLVVLSSPSCVAPGTYDLVESRGGGFEPTASSIGTSTVTGRAAIISALSLPSSFLTSESFNSSSFGRYLLGLDATVPMSEVRAAFAAAGFSLPLDDLGVSPQGSPMPEPMSLLLVGAGLAGLGAVIRRRRAA